MVGNWFVGSFSPTAHPANFEVSYKVHKKDEVCPAHFHKRATEVNLLVRGKMSVNKEVVNAGEIFIIEPYMVAEVEFFEDSELVVVKTVSDTKDKYLI